MSHQLKGVLEIDETRGVIYFHHETEVTTLRISNLPVPVPIENTNLLDITYGVGVSWQSTLKEETCTCWPVPEEQHTTYGGSTEPGSMWEFNPDCPTHGQGDVAPDKVEVVETVDL